MKMHSSTPPDALHQSGGVWYFNLNAEQQTLNDVTQYVCDSIAIDGAPSRDKLIAAGMQARYSRDDEFALINKGIADPQDPEYLQYLQYRIDVKTQVGDAGFPAAE